MFKLILKTVLILLINTPSHAYLGPGIAGGTILAILGIIFAFIALIFGLVWFPIKRLIKKMKTNNKKKKIDK